MTELDQKSVSLSVRPSTTTSLRAASPPPSRRAATRDPRFSASGRAVGRSGEGRNTFGRSLVYHSWERRFFYNPDERMREGLREGGRGGRGRGGAGVHRRAVQLMRKSLARINTTKWTPSNDCRSLGRARRLYPWMIWGGNNLTECPHLYASPFRRTW